MKRLSFFAIMLMVVSVSFFSSGCDEVFCEDGSGGIEERNFSFSTIDGVDLTVDGEVFVTYGQEQSVRVVANRNVMDELDLFTSNGNLVIDLERCFDDYTLEVYLTLAAPLEEARLSGSGSIIGQNRIPADDYLEIKVSGSGDISLEIEGDRIDSKISGSGKLFLEGLANHHDARISGSGDLDAYGLSIRDYEVKISGSGNSYLFVDGGHLKVDISGSGEVNYRGNPELISSEITGSGRIRNRN
jgi:hypothetical protein